MPKTAWEAIVTFDGFETLAELEAFAQNGGLAQVRMFHGMNDGPLVVELKKPEVKK